MQQLEAELGVRLFVRRGKHVQLTEAGRALQEQADSLTQRALALQLMGELWGRGKRFGIVPLSEECIYW